MMIVGMRLKIGVRCSGVCHVLRTLIGSCGRLGGIFSGSGGFSGGRGGLSHWLRALGVTGAIKSPTYTLIERYPIPGGEAAHLDLYRLAGAAELDFLGLDELAADATLWLVEWPERGAGGLPAPDLRLWLGIEGAGRRAVLEAGSATGRAWLGRLAEVPE